MTDPARRGRRRRLVVMIGAVMALAVPVFVGQAVSDHSDGGARTGA
jgi:hypothetical protein